MNTRTNALIGGIAWLAFVIAAHVALSGAGWTYVLLAFSALVLVPLALDLAAERRDTGRLARTFTWVRRVQLPAAALLALACGMRPGLWALLAALPWAAVTALLASIGVERIFRDAWARPLDRLSTDVGLGYLVIGGLWLLVDRAGLRPLHFQPEIVALTATHFHFAGFLLPIFAGQVFRRMPDSRFAGRGVVGVILGVPAVAAGITATQLGWLPAFEAAAGCGLALAGLTVAILHVRVALDATEGGAVGRLLVGVCGVALFFAMLLAAAYAIRNFAAPLPWLGLPQMRATHGTLLAFGFGLCGVLGWRSLDAAEKRSRKAV